MDDKVIRVLQVIVDLKKGGVQAEIMYPARILDKRRVHFDVMLLSDTTGYYEEEFKQYGDIFRIPLKKKKTKLGRVSSVFLNYFIIRKQMISFFKSHEPYDAVHAHDFITNAACVSAAKKCRVPVRIAYCALNKPKTDRLYFKLYLKACSFVLNRCCTHKFGVTQNAADYVFGKDKGRPIKNPTVDFLVFDPGKYQFESDGIIHMIMVGSYSARKNQKFAVDILDELRKRKVDADLTFIGYPRSTAESYFPELQNKVADLELNERVRFFPQDTNVAEAMGKSSMLLITSLWEGLPNVSLEAQRMGLPCFISEDVSDDCDCGLCHFLPLEKGAEYWAEMIVEFFSENGFHKQYVDMSEWDNRKICEYYYQIWSGKA